MIHSVNHSSQHFFSACAPLVQGTTRLLLTRIPHFREIVLMAFECPHCYERNSEVQFAGRLEPRGVTLTLQVPENDREALNRQVVKADHATVRIPELEFEIPEQAQRGSLTTVSTPPCAARASRAGAQARGAANVGRRSRAEEGSSHIRRG